MRATLEAAADTGATSCWLGVNQRNVRAARFYTKHGFAVVGTKRFRSASGGTTTTSASARSPSRSLVSRDLGVVVAFMPLLDRLRQPQLQDRGDLG